MFNFISTVYELDYFKKLSKIKENNPSAGDLGKDHCINCCYCCWVRPCWLDKDDPAIIAKYLSISIKELFKKFLVVDFFSNSYIILPRRVEQEDIAGMFTPANRTYDCDTPCIFLDYENKKCKIHDVKPIGGREMKCWVNDKRIQQPPEWSREEIMEMFGWDGVEVDGDRIIEEDEY